MSEADITHGVVFGPFRFDPASGELHGPDGSIKLRAQASLALQLLLSQQGEVVSRHELREALWADDRVVLYEASIAAIIRELRRALGDDSKAPRFIETIPKRGYRFMPQAARTVPDLAVVVDSSRHKISGSMAFSGYLVLAAGLALLMFVLSAGDGERVRSLSSAAVDSDPVTVAVLAFDELSGRAEYEVLADTLHRELVGWLGAVAPDRLRVLNRTGAEETGLGLPDEKPVDFMVVGSVRDDHDAATVSVELLVGADGSFAWGEQYRRNAQDMGLTAREVAARITDRVVAKSLPQWSSGASGVSSSNLAAVDAFRRGTEALAQLSQEKTLEAVEAFSEATELDPEFSAAHAYLAEALINWAGPAVTQDRVERARQAALTSIELFPDNAVGRRVLGEIELYYDRDWQAAGVLLEQSVTLAPSSALAHHSYAVWLSSRGRHDDALRAIDLAAALEPASVAISLDVMFLHYYARDFEGTLSAAQRLKQLWPHSLAPHRYIVLSRLATGDTAAAAAEARTVLAGTDPASTAAEFVRALSDSEALEAYWNASVRGISQHVRENSGDPTALAMPYVQLGQFDEANSALESALTSGRFSYFLPFLGVSPAYDRMCGHVRFERILRRLRQSALTDGRDLPRCATAIANATGPQESL